MKQEKKETKFDDVNIGVNCAPSPLMILVVNNE